MKRNINEAIYQSALIDASVGGISGITQRNEHEMKCERSNSMRLSVLFIVAMRHFSCYSRSRSSQGIIVRITEFFPVLLLSIHKCLINHYDIIAANIYDNRKLISVTFWSDFATGSWQVSAKHRAVLFRKKCKLLYNGKRRQRHFARTQWAVSVGPCYIMHVYSSLGIIPPFELE